MLRSFAKSSLEALLRSFGYELHVIGEHLRGFNGFLALIKDRGFEPGLVIDAGVGRGTTWLYEAFPRSKFVLFEALPAFEPHLKGIMKQVDAEYHLCALNDSDGEIPLYVPENALEGSSLLRRDESWQATLQGNRIAPVRETRVASRRLDGFELPGSNYLLKLDVEGAELAVLRGATKTLARTEVIISELRVEHRHAGQSDMAAVMSYLAEQGFKLFDIIEMESTAGGPLAFVDAAFIRADSRLLSRQDRRSIP